MVNANSLTYNGKAFVSGGHRCNLLSTASCPPACTNAVLAAVFCLMYISKKDREIVKNKFGGKCAYTGTELKNDWQDKAVYLYR